MITLPGIAIQSQIYESSASLVYRGIEISANRACCFADTARVVIKLLKQDYPSPQELTRYRQEYEITRSLNLAGVVKAYSQQDYQRTLAIVLEDFGGESIERWMQQCPEAFYPMPLSNFFRFAIDLTVIVGSIHAAGIIHKDINPSNIVLNQETGVVKIIDFGIATRFSRTSPTFQNLHRLEGTPAYLSPEQTGRMNRWLDYRSDFYSLGVTFYELLTGQLPFPTTDILGLIHCHIAKPPVPPHELNATIPKPISDLILKLMAKNAEDRYQSAWGIKADLERCADEFTQRGQIDHFQLGLQDVSEQFQIPQRLYGREAEIRTLLAAFDQVVGEEEPPTPDSQLPLRSHSAMMLVSGYAGIGKSALVQELYKPITAKRGYFVSGKFDQFQRNVPYSAIASALQKLVQQLLGEPDEQMQQWRSRLLTALGNNGQIIVDVIPEVELMMGKQSPVPEVGAKEAQNRFDRVFQQFIRMFCSAEHPLVIFLDDLQWVDSATLRLIELMMTDAETRYLFLIGAYRDNEVNPAHPLMITLESLKKEQVILSQLTLAPLGLNAIAQLITDTLHSDIVTVSPLAELVLRKTGGNPFFVNVFLKMLYTESLLRFDGEHLRWQWDIAHIESKDITDNVVELMLCKLQKLPIATQQVLQLAACVGADFDLSTLSIICERSPNEIFPELVTAVQSGLIVSTSELDEHLLVQNYRFLHDRVQQAAYALIDDSQKQVAHLQIGRNLLEKTLSEQLSVRLFAIVDHLNQGIELVTAQPERTEIAKLNLMTGQKAKAATAYEAALQYFNIGLQLLDTESWQNEYDLTLALYSKAAEAAYLQGRFSEMEHFVEVVLNHAKTVVDKVQVYDSRIQGYLSQGNSKEALKIGLEVLKFLGVSLIETPSQLDVQRGLEETAALLAGREIEDLINLPKMTTPEPLAAMYILANIASAGCIVSPALIVLIGCKMVNLSVDYGNTIWSPLSYVTYGFALCGVVQDIELGYKFGKLALSLAEKLNTKKGSAKALWTFGVHVLHWKVHFRETIPTLVDAYQNGVETGDFEFAGYAAYNVCFRSFFVGEELTQLEQKTATYSKAIGQIRRQSPSNWIAMLWQTILNLLGRSENPSRLIGSAYDEEQALSRAIAVKDGNAIQFFYLFKVILCYLFEEYQQAAQSAVLATQYLEEIRARTIVPLFYFYHSLVLLSLSLDASSSEKAAWLSCISTNQEKMQKWAEHAPMNYLHKYHLVEAEKARVLEQFPEAEELYEQAIAGAAEHEFIQEEALAYELAAKHYLARGRSKIAQTYMKESHYCYERWGATAKVKDLETRYPQFFAQSSRDTSTSIHTTARNSSSQPAIAFDLAAVLKASQAISREIELEQLLSSLMQILIENAGAQIGYLILDNSGKWLIEASCELNENVFATQVLQSTPTANQLPESIIQYVIRTHQSVILNDATREANFAYDPYIQQHQTKSIFCLPLLNQAKLVGVLYLENQLAVGVFTPERSQVLNLLSTQAAIAIENAKLYAKLAASKNKLTQFIEAVPVGIGIVDADGHPFYVNQRATQLVGKESDPSLPLEHLAEAYHFYLTGTNKRYPTEKLALFRALRGERTWNDDLEIHKNDTIIPVETWGTPVYDKQGNVIYAIVAFQDITERKQSEKLLADYNQTLEQQIVERTAALQQSEANYRNLVQTANSIILRCDAQGRIQYLNDYGLKFFGYEKHEILERTLLETIVPEIETSGRVLKQFIHDVFHNRLDPASYLQMENENLCRDGRRVWVAWSNQAILNEQGELVEILSVGNDITQRKQVEEALQRSEAKFRTIFENSQVGIFRTRFSDGLILDANQRLAELFGFDSPNEIIGLKQSIDYYVNFNDRQQAIELLDWNDELQNFEVQLRKRDGTMFWGLYSCRLNAGDGYVEGVLTDIGDRKRAEEASILEERNRMAREIHDTLAQSFTGILIQVGAATQVLTDDPEATQSHLNTIEALAHTGLTEARRSVKALRPQLLEEGDLSSALDRLVSHMKAATDAALIYEIQGIAYSIPSEVENNLLRIGQEALTNAIKYAHAREIRVELVYDDAQCRLRVKDDGEGFGVVGVPMSGGFGLLGMSERAERIGAQLTIESQPGQGTEIVVIVNRG
jgi:PAS domain S-box-containing protein